MGSEDIFRGLGDPTRLRIMMLLLNAELCVCDLMAVLQLPQSTVSRHMGRLKSVGLVADSRYGKWVHYRLAHASAVSDLRDYLERNLVKLEPYRGDRVTLNRLVRSGRCASVSREASPRIDRGKELTNPSAGGRSS